MASQHQQQSFSGLHYKPGRSLKPQHDGCSANYLKFTLFIFSCHPVLQMQLKLSLIIRLITICVADNLGKEIRYFDNFWSKTFGQSKVPRNRCVTRVHEGV